MGKILKDDTVQQTARAFHPIGKAMIQYSLYSQML